MWVLLLVPWVDIDDSRRRPPGPPPPPPALLDVSMRVSGIGAVVVYFTYRCVDIVDSGLRGEHGWSSRGDRVLLLSSECCRGRVFRNERRRGSRRRLGERGGGRHHESREEECVYEREARFGAPVTRHGARGRVRRVGRVGRVTRVGSAHVSLGSVPFRKSRGWDHERVRWECARAWCRPARRQLRALLECIISSRSCSQPRDFRNGTEPKLT